MMSPQLCQNQKFHRLQSNRMKKKVKNKREVERKRGKKSCLLPKRKLPTYDGSRDRKDEKGLRYGFCGPIRVKGVCPL